MMAVEDGVDLDFDETETAQIRYVLRKVMMQGGAQQFLHRHGILDDALWERYLAWARAFIRSPHGVDWWAQDQHNAIYPREFVNLLNASPTSESS